MMSTGEVARGIGVTERTVRRWCEAGFRVLPDGTRSPVSARRMDGRAWLIDAALCWCGAVVLLTPSELDKETAWGRCPCGTSVTHTTWRRQGDGTK
jgi:predicted transcriptional regulator